MKHGSSSQTMNYYFALPSSSSCNAFSPGLIPRLAHFDRALQGVGASPQPKTEGCACDAQANHQAARCIPIRNEAENVGPRTLRLNRCWSQYPRVAGDALPSPMLKRFAHTGDNGPLPRPPRSGYVPDPFALIGSYGLKPPT